MNTFESNYQQLFNYIKTSLPNDEVVIMHPNNSNLTRGTVCILPLVDSLAGRYSCGSDVRGDEFQITLYHQNFGEIIKLQSRVREAIKNFIPNQAEAVNVGNLQTVKTYHAKYIGTISLWQVCIIIRWYYQQKN